MTTTNRKRTAASDKILGKKKEDVKKKLVKKNVSSVDALTTKIIGNPAFGSTTKLTANLLVNAVLDAIKERLVTGEVVSLPGIGKLQVIETKERKGRNPSNGKSLVIPPKKKLRFSAYTSVKKELND